MNGRSFTEIQDHDLKRFAVANQEADARSELIVPPPSLMHKGGIYFIAAALLAILLILVFAKASVVVTAKGQIVPEGDLRVIQSLEGGVVSRVAVQPGDRLKQGAVVLTLDLPESSINFEELMRKTERQREQLLSLNVGRAMLDDLLRSGAASATSVPAVASALQAAHAHANARMRLETARQELAALPERRQLLLKQMQLVTDNIRYAEKALENYPRSLAGQQTGFEEKTRQIRALRALFDKKVLSAVEIANEEEKYRAAEQAVAEARQRLDQQSMEIGNQRLKLSELQTQMNAEGAAKQRDYREAEAAAQQAVAAVAQERSSLEGRISELEGEIALAEARLRVAGNRLALSTITSPIAGVVADVKVSGLGSLVSAGSPVATIVPDSVELSVLVSVRNKDIASIHSGTAARIKVDAFPYQQYGTLAARVTRVLPNIAKENTFPVRLELKTLDLGGGSLPARVFPGLEVQADLITSRRRLISLLFDSAGGR